MGRKGNRFSGTKKEKVIMLASSAFVMAALTISGLFLKEDSEKQKQDGYLVDFESLDQHAQKQTDQIADLAGLQTAKPTATPPAFVQPTQTPAATLKPVRTPQSQPKVEYSGNGGNKTADADLISDPDYLSSEEMLAMLSETEEPEAEEVSVEPKEVRILNFSLEQGLTAPVDGGILMHYSMERTTYFATLDQYKYNPAVIFDAGEGEEVRACADAQVAQIYENEEIGQAMLLDLGGGYQALIGQLKDLKVDVGDYVEEGSILGFVAAPTIYYSVEGANVYFALTLDGDGVNPEKYLK